MADGIFQNQTEVNAHTDEYGTVIQPNAQPGDIRFKDLNHDGKLDDNDKTFIGNAFPDLMVGINARLAWKNIDFAANFYGTIGNDVYNTTKGRYSGVSGENVYAGPTMLLGMVREQVMIYPVCQYNDANQNWTRGFFFLCGRWFLFTLQAVADRIYIAKEMDEENFIAPVFLGTESVHYYRIFRNGP